MKAIVTTAYGPPAVLQLRDVDTPAPKPNEVLIRIRATTVTAGDCESRRFDFPLLYRLPLRLLIGITRPRKGFNILGQELAGEITEVGEDVESFEVGAGVFAATGIRFGAHAEYVALPASEGVALKPTNMSYEEAAGVPVGGLNALHFLKKARIQSGQKVLIYGSTGSIGTFAVQLARVFGGEVTAVCGPGDHELVRSLGAARSIDYTSEDFTENGETYDVIFDTIGKSPYARSLKSLKKGGFYLLANPGLNGILRGPWTSTTTAHTVVVEAAGYAAEGFRFLTELIEADKLNSVIDRRYPLEEMVEAHRYVEQGHKKGNVVITVP